MSETRKSKLCCWNTVRRRRRIRETAAVWDPPPSDDEEDEELSDRLETLDLDKPVVCSSADPDPNWISFLFSNQDPWSNSFSRRDQTTQLFINSLVTDQLLTTSFVVMSTSLLATTIRNGFLPSEVALVRFSISGGVQEEWSRCIEGVYNQQKESGLYLLLGDSMFKFLVDSRPEFGASQMVLTPQCAAFHNRKVVDWIILNCRKTRPAFNLSVEVLDIQVLIKHIAGLKNQPPMDDKQVEDSIVTGAVAAGDVCEYHGHTLQHSNCALATAKRWVRGLLDLVRPMVGIDSEMEEEPTAGGAFKAM